MRRQRKRITLERKLLSLTVMMSSRSNKFDFVMIWNCCWTSKDMRQSMWPSKRFKCKCVEREIEWKKLRENIVEPLNNILSFLYGFRSGNDVYFDENAFHDKIGMDPFNNHSLWIVDIYPYGTTILMLM